jgi:hypothetical protein
MKWRILGVALALFTSNGSTAALQPDIVYLNRCAGSCTVYGGIDNAITSTSSLFSGTATLAAFPGSDATFDALAACVRHVLLPFNIHVVANNPGPVARREIMISTTASQIGASNTPGLVPYDGNPHDNTIAMEFANAISTSNPEPLCHLAAQQVALLYALDYVVNCPDIMDGTVSCGEKSFTNLASACTGTLSGNPGHCFNNSTTQNSYLKILAVASATDFVFVNSFEGFEVPRAGPSP